MVVLALVLSAIISIAAVVDPFAWMPSVGELWADCTDDYDTSKDECDWNTRWPGFWGHAALNLLYTAIAAGLLVWVAATVGHVREARSKRFAGAAEYERYLQVRQRLTTAAVATATAAILPVAAALA